MSSWSNKVKAGVYAGIDDSLSVDTCVLRLNKSYLVKICVESGLDIAHNWNPRIGIVDIVTEPRSVDTCQLQFDTIFLEISIRMDIPWLDGCCLNYRNNTCRESLDLNGLWRFRGRVAALFLRIQRRIEERVDERGFAKARFAFVSDLIPTSCVRNTQPSS